MKTPLKFAANLSFLFTELPFLDRFAAAALAGFRAVEFTFPYEHDAGEIRSRLDRHGLTLVLFNLPPGDWSAGERGLTALTGRESEFRAGLMRALEYADALDCRRLHAMAGLNRHGAGLDTYRTNLSLASRLAARTGVDILIEPINTFDMPDYFLTTTEQAAEVIAAVGAPNLGLQLDLYHRHRMQGGAAGALQRYRSITRHYQIAGPPDRGEPDDGDLDYRPLLEAIASSGFDGYIGLEYKPRGETTAGLAWMRTLAAGLV